MNIKKVITPITAFLLISALVLILNHFWGMPLKHIIVEITAITLYAVLIIVFFLRFALIFLGVFAIYRILQKRQNKQSLA